MPRGRAKYKPTESDRNTVKAMATGGLPHETICKCLSTDGISLKTMYRHFREELDTALDRANAAVVSRAYQMAVQGDPPAATFFWLKCRARWKEIQSIEHSEVNVQVAVMMPAPALSSAPQAQVVEVKALRK